MQEIKNRDDALAAGQAALQTGLEIGMLNLPIAALGWPAAECVVAGELTLGTSCVRFALAVLAAIGRAAIGFDQAGEAWREADRLGQSARGIFEELGP
jgi:hypothetical protein